MKVGARVLTSSGKTGRVVYANGACVLVDLDVRPRYHPRVGSVYHTRVLTEMTG